MGAELVKAHCNRCGGETHHHVVCQEKTEGEEPYDERYSISWWDTYTMLRCAGCDNVTLRHVSSFSEHDDVTVAYYPPRITRREPTWMPELMLATTWADFNEQRTTIYVLLKEVYVALHNASRSLAGMGVRALLDMVMTDKVGDQGNFADTFAAFKRQGYLSDHDVKTLETVLDAGHASVHRKWRPELRDLNTALDITENVIQAIYINASKAKELAKKVPPREKK